MKYVKNIVEEMEKIYQILNELQYCQINQLIDVQNNQSIIMKKLNLLHEYNEIDDMNNAVIDKKLNEILEKI